MTRTRSNHRRRSGEAGPRNGGRTTAPRRCFPLAYFSFAAALVAIILSSTTTAGVVVVDAFARPPAAYFRRSMASTSGSAAAAGRLPRRIDVDRRRSRAADPPSSRSAGLSASSADADPVAADSTGASTDMAQRALLISSFTDGVLASPPALSFLKYGLASALADSIVRDREEDVKESVLNSPCQGPDIDMLDALEEADAASAAAEAGVSSRGERDYGALADALLGRILGPSDGDNNDSGDPEPVLCRVLYIPTAMYALNPTSKNTPGKQRQRARADGKKRRNQVVKAVDELLNSPGKKEEEGRRRRKVDVLAVTLDFADGSVKQPVGSDDASLFPTDGHEAVSAWSPHLVYVEGGNTFWLTHCLEEGGWEEELQAAVCGGDDGGLAAVYVGKSAGAILAGERVETAAWKGWDDPSVVDSRPSYSDWTGHPGLSLAGSGASFFPHMSDEWLELVEERRGPLEEEQGKVFCLREWEACCVDGVRGEVFLVEGERGE